MKTVSYEKNSLYIKQILTEIGLKKKILGLKKKFNLKTENSPQFDLLNIVEGFLKFSYFFYLTYLFKVISN
jgi:hypothetical protein